MLYLRSSARKSTRLVPRSLTAFPEETWPSANKEIASHSATLFCTSSRLRPYASKSDGIVETGNTDYDSSFIRVLDEGGMIWSTTDAYPSLDSALAAADAAIAEWCSVHIPDLVVGTTVSPPYTLKQGQYLAYIHQYTQLHGQAPAEHEIQAFFGVTPPTVDQMILRLEQLGFISRVPRQARSIEVLLPAETLPPLRRA